MSHWRRFASIMVIASVTVFIGCAELAKELVDEDPTPTNDLVPGVWKVTEAVNTETNESFLSKVTDPIPAYFSLTEMRSLASTAGPLWVYIVYGDNAMVQIGSRIDQVFDYKDLTYNDGEFAVADGVVDRFTIEVKLKALGTSSLGDMLDWIGINTPQWTEPIIYHKFLQVGIEFSADADTMYWTFDGTTEGRYNYKDINLDYVAMDGVDVTGFTHSRITLVKQTSGFEDLIKGDYGITD